MNYYLVAPIVIVSQNQSFFTYHTDRKLVPGQIVSIPLGKRQTIGIIFRAVDQPDFATKSITQVIEEQPLPKHLLKLSQWISQYYCASLALTLKLCLPSGLTKKRRTLSKETFNNNPVFLQPTPAQQEVIEQILYSTSPTQLLHGITGSGKTTIYLELARHSLKAQQSVLVIVPEIALTAQLIQQFKNYFPRVLTFHSSLTEAQRHHHWQTCLRSQEAMVVVGTRSALFMPLRKLGLIIIDEFHEPSLKQDKTPRYSAVRVASQLARLGQARLILGSATPPIADYWLAKQKHTPILSLTETAIKALKPSITLIDMTQRRFFSKHRFLSNDLLAAIDKSLSKQEQVLIFHNRRGTSSASFCQNCAWVVNCPNCHTPMTMHADQFQMTCHICSHKSRIPTSCPICQTSQIVHRGIGTKLIETELRKIFKTARIQRFDADSPRSKTVDKLYQQLVGGDIDILIGTQVLAKGLNLPKLSTVGIVQADAGLFLPDFQAQERNFQLLAQVVGRVGRNQHSTQIIAQTYHPTEPSIVFGLAQDYTNFYRHAIDRRRQLNYPPFCYLLQLKVSYQTEAACLKQSAQIAQRIRQLDLPIEIIGPTPCFYEKINQRINWQLIIKSRSRSHLQKIIPLLPTTHWQYDIDPSSLL